MKLIEATWVALLSIIFDLTGKFEINYQMRFQHMKK